MAREPWWTYRKQPDETEIDAIIQKLARAGLPRTGGIVGCTPEEVREVAIRQKTKLPAIYEEFLLKLGRCIGLEHTGEYWFFPAVLEMREEAEDYLRGYTDDEDCDPTDDEAVDSDFSLTEDAVVFSTYLGGSFLYMRTSEGDDPPVYRFGDGVPNPPMKLSDRYSRLLSDALLRVLRQ